MIMNKKLKIILISISAVSFCVMLYFVCAFFGNPVSYLLSKNAADNYIADNFSAYNLEIEKVGYDFKVSGYYANVVSPDSIDTHFTIYFDLLGRPDFDTFENVKNGWNTAMRLEDEYRQVVNSVEDEIKKDFTTDIFYGEIKTSEISDDYSGKEPYGIKISDYKDLPQYSKFFLRPPGTKSLGNYQMKNDAKLRVRKRKFH